MKIPFTIFSCLAGFAFLFAGSLAAEESVNAEQRKFLRRGSGRLWSNIATSVTRRERRKSVPSCCSTVRRRCSKAVSQARRWFPERPSAVC
jgi:hypothetical protein